MNESKRSGNNGVWWRCMKRTCRKSRLVREGIFFTNTNLSLNECMLLIYLWTSGTPEKQVLHDYKFSSHTVVDWVNYCREVGVDYFDELDVKIGGIETIVEIDEAVIVKRKYDRGRVLKEGWPFEGIQRTTDGSFKCFMRVVYNRCEVHLLHIIKQHVLPGTHIITDAWPAYRNMSKHGYEHSVVIHKDDFISPADPRVHTQKIESTWCSLKRFLRSRGTNRCPHLVDYIYE
jgi:hypothetical protein